MQEERRAEVEPRRGPGLFLAVAGATLAADQAAKTLALSLLVPGVRVELLGKWVGFEAVHNSGGAFGLLPGRPLFFLAASLLVMGGVTAWALRHGESPVPLGLMLGGGAGNVVDRLFRGDLPLHGKVVDFIDLSFWPTFNLADAAIVVGAGLLLLTGITQRK